MDKQLSIIIPVYNVEKYVRPCVESILRQGLPEEQYEMVIVNDGTPDRSMEQIADIIESHANITVINQENQGLSVARNNGLACATGEYVVFFDSDDMIADGSLPLMLKKATESKADMVIGGHRNLTNEEIASLDQTSVQQSIEWKEWATGKELFVAQYITSSMVWDKLYRRDFLLKHQLLFIPGLYFEDTPFTFDCYFKAGKCLISNLLLCIHRLQESSICSTYSMRHARDASISLGKTWALRKTAALSKKEYKVFQNNTFHTFQVIMKKTMSHLLGFNDRLQAMDYLAENAPDLCFSEGLQQKAISFLYRLSPRLLMMLWIWRWDRKGKGS